VHPEFPDDHHWKFARKCHHRRASLALRDHPDLLVHLASLAHPVPTAIQEALERMAETDRPAHLDPTDHPALQARTERRDHPATPRSAPHQHPASPDPLVRTVLPDHLVKMARPAPTEPRDQRATKARPDQLVRPATTALLATRDHPDRMAPRENRVFAPNIAPPTEASSSKTAQGDKRSRKRFVAVTRNRFSSCQLSPLFFSSRPMAISQLKPIPPPRPPSLASVPFEISIEAVIAGIAKIMI